MSQAQQNYIVVQLISTRKGEGIAYGMIKKRLPMPEQICIAGLLYRFTANTSIGPQYTQSLEKSFAEGWGPFFSRVDAELEGEQVYGSKAGGGA